jgi:RNA polymerase sigma-70 factor (ECF subfamily)
MQDQDILVDLIARCALRDQRALKQLYEKVSPYLNRVAYNIMKSDDLANDVLQEAFVQIWHNAGDYRPDKAKPLTWLTSITRYRALDRLAKEQRHADKVSVDAELEAMA